MSKSPGGKGRLSPAAPRAGRGGDVRGRHALRVVEGERRTTREKDRGTHRPAGGRRNASPVVRRRRHLAVMLFVLAAAGLVTYLLLGPILRNVDSHRSLAELEGELEAERAKTAELEQRSERAQSNEYVEEEARGMNYVKPGEIPIIVLDDEEAPEPAPEGSDQPDEPVETTP